MRTVTVYGRDHLIPDETLEAYTDIYGRDLVRKRCEDCGAASWPARSVYQVEDWEHWCPAVEQAKENAYA